MNTSVSVAVMALGYHGHEIARTLGRLGVRVYGIHADPRSPTMRSRYWRENFIWNIDEADPGRSVDSLLQLGRRIGSRPLLIATDDDGCTLIADYADRLQEAFLFPEQPAGLTRMLSNKQQMFYLCKKHSIPTAETLFPQSRDDVIEFSKTVTFPVMLKGIDTLLLRARTGVKMVCVHDAATLLKLYDEMETPAAPNLMVQEYFEGGSETSWMFNGYFDGESNCLFGLTAHMIRQYPPYGGRTSLGVCGTNEIVGRQTKDFMKAIGYRGPLDIGFKHNRRTGEYKTIDVNPRIGATFRLLVDTAGMDVAKAFYLHMTGQPVVCGEPREQRKWVVENFDLLSSPTYCRKEKLSIWDWLRSYRGVEEASWFAWDDLAPFIFMIWSSLRWAVEQMVSKISKSRSGRVVTGKRVVAPLAPPLN